MVTSLRIPRPGWPRTRLGSLSCGLPGWSGLRGTSPYGAILRDQSSYQLVRLARYSRTVTEAVMPSQPHYLGRRDEAIPEREPPAGGMLEPAWLTNDAEGAQRSGGADPRQPSVPRGRRPTPNLIPPRLAARLRLIHGDQSTPIVRRQADPERRAGNGLRHPIGVGVNEHGFKRE
jgi:hypothetical protein